MSTENDEIIRPEYEYIDPDRLRRLERMIEDIHQRLFIGNGRPSLTTQIDRHDQQLGAIRWVLGATIVVLIGSIAKMLFNH